jgi:putative membrane protein insertion efficiency factor
MTRRNGSSRIAGAAVYLIELYRNMISPFRPPACRFTPTCSQYAVDALRGHGLMRGAWLAIARLAKCGPWHRGGWDPIPEPRHDHHTHVADDAATSRSDSLV